MKIILNSELKKHIAYLWDACINYKQIISRGDMETGEMKTNWTEWWHILINSLRFLIQKQTLSVKRVNTQMTK